MIDDFVLAYYIRRMPSDGHYKAISYLLDWVNGSYRTLARASAKSFLRKGVEAKRIFICNTPLDDDLVVEFMRQQEQLRLETQKRYEWRLCDPADVNGEVARAVPVGYYESASSEDPAKVAIERAQPKRQFSQSTADENHLLDASFMKLWDKCGDPREVVARLAPGRMMEVFKD